MKRDMTSGTEWKVILLFTLPIMAGNLLQQFYNTADGIILGNFVGERALSAIGSCASLALIFVCLALGFSTGAGIMVAQLFGARRTGDLRRAVSTSLILLLGMGLVLSVVGALLAPWFMSVLLGVPEGAIRDMATEYFRIYCCGILFQFAYNIFAAILRALGDSRATLYFLLISTVMNILLDLLFVAVFNWSVAGAAWATVIAQGASAAVSAIYAFRRYEVLRFKRSEFVFDAEKCRIALKFGIPMTIQQSCISVGILFVQRLVNGFGEVTMAAFTAGGRIEMYCSVPFMSFSAGLSTFVGQNMGAGRVDRVLRGQRGTMAVTLIFSVVVSVLAWLFARPLASVFGVEGKALAQAMEYIRFMSFFYILFSLYGTFTATLQGSGDVIFASVCTMISFVVRCSTAYLFAYALGVGYESCWVTIPIGWACCTPVAYLRFKLGAWKNKAIATVSGEKPNSAEG